MGLISNIFNDESIKKLKGNVLYLCIIIIPVGISLKLYCCHIGNLGIGHTRYSTSAGSEEVNCQPFVVHSAHGALAVAHNGELFNAGRLRRMVIIILFILICLFLICY